MSYITIVLLQLQGFPQDFGKPRNILTCIKWPFWGRQSNFCMTNNTVIGGTIFEHKNIHKLTWRFPDGLTVNQIDHVIIINKW